VVVGLDAQAGKPATFNLQMNGAHGEIKAHVDTPAGTEEDVFVTEVSTTRSNIDGKKP